MGWFVGGGGVWDESKGRLRSPKALGSGVFFPTWKHIFWTGSKTRDPLSDSYVCGACETHQPQARENGGTC